MGRAQDAQYPFGVVVGLCQLVDGETMAPTKMIRKRTLNA